MERTKPISLTALAAALAFGVANAASAAQVEITFTNNSPLGGLFLTPVFSVFHDGTFDSFDAGSAASAEVELLAEEGNFAPELTRAQAAGQTTSAVFVGPNGFGSTAPQPPLLDAGESSTVTVDLDPASDVFFSFLSMVLPSNDNFIGNDDPMAYRLFDAAGNFTGLGPITVLGRNVWDAGTEENTLLGAPFTTAGGTATDTTAGVVSAQADLDFILGTSTPVGTIGSVQGPSDLLATISFREVAAVPVPAALPMLALGLTGLGLFATRRKRTA